MKIDLRLLRQAQALAVHRSFRRAAESLDISQPTLSRSIKDLETQVGLQLFNRSRSGHELTDFGRMFMQRAAELLAGADDLEREVALAKGGESGALSVGFGVYAAEAIAPIAGARFATTHPTVPLRFMIDGPVAVARLLRTRRADLCVAEAIVFEHDDGFETITKLAPLPGNVIVRTGHPLTRIKSIKLADVLEYPFAQVVMVAPRALKPILAARRSTPGTTPALPFPAIECSRFSVASKIVASSNAFMLASLGMVRTELEQRQVVAVLQESWNRADLSIVRLRKQTRSPAMIAFVEELQRAHAEVLREDELLRKRWCP